MFRRIISKKLRIMRVSFPAWVLGVALLVVAAAAGQAVGPVLSGGIQGSACLVIEQSVVLGPSGFSLGGGSDNDGIFTTNDDGTGYYHSLLTGLYWDQPSSKFEGTYQVQCGAGVTAHRTVIRKAPGYGSAYATSEPGTSV